MKNRKVAYIAISGMAVLYNCPLFAQAENFNPELATTPPALVNPAGAAPAPANAVEPVKPVFQGEDNITKSLFFSDADISAIRNARLFYEQHRSGNVVGGIAEDDFLKSLEKISATKSETVSKTFTYPQFFLSSIAYQSPNDWVVWINDEKIIPSSGVSSAGLKVLSINNEKVTIEWQPERMDKIADESDTDGSVQVDFMKNKVIFTLKANQTFTSYAMRVVEGKVAPVTVDLSADAKAKMLAK